MHEHLPGRLLGLDTSGVFDRSAPLPPVLHRTIGRNQLDGDVTPSYARDRTGVGEEEPCYEDVASKFWEHFIYIAHAMSHRGHDSRDCGTRRWLLLRRTQAAVATSFQ